MEPTRHVPRRIRTLNRRSFLGVSLGSAAGLGAALSFAPELARARPIEPASGAASERATNVIFMVSDGMSFGTLTLAEIMKRVRDGKSTSWVQMWGMPGARRAVMRTASADSLVTDSSAASSSWGCGEHINNDAVNFTPDKRTPVPILVQAAQNGMATGLVTTTRITHATPAGFIANCPSRNAEDIIAEQIIQRGVDVALGGGSKYFPEKLLATRPNLRVLRTRADFEGLPPVGGGPIAPVLGIFEKSHLLYELDRGETDPPLADLARGALKRLERSPRGFVLQIEGGRVDHAAHANDAPSLVAEQLSFDRTLGAVLEWMQGRDDTLLIVTTDHGNANPGLTLYGPETYRGLERLAQAKHSFEWLFEQLGMKLTYDDAGAGTHLSEEDRVASVVREATGVQLERDELSAFIAALRGKHRELFAPMSGASSVLGSCLANHFGVGFISPNHTSDFVEVTAIGPGSGLIGPFIDNIDLHGVMTGAVRMAPARAI